MKNFLRSSIFGMKTAFFLVCLCTSGFYSCSDDYDDTEIRGSISSLESMALESWCTTVNNEIKSLQTLIAAMDAGDYVTNIEEMSEGYNITFADNGVTTLYKGEAPIISVAKHTDGYYYWTIRSDSEKHTALTDADGNMILCHSGTMERDAAGAKPVPQLKTGSKLGSDYEPKAVYLSVDGGTTWTKISNDNEVKGTFGNLNDIRHESGSNIEIVLTNGISFKAPYISDRLLIMTGDAANTFTVTSSLLENGNGNVADIRVESENATGNAIHTYAAETRWVVESDIENNVMTITLKPANTVYLGETALLKVTISDANGKILASGQKVFTNELPNNSEAIVANAEELQSALTDDEKTYIAIESDITLSEVLSVSSDKKIDLKDNTLTTLKNVVSSDGGVLTITNGKIIQQNGASICNVTNGSIELDNVDYEGSGWSCIFNDRNAENTHITIRNSTVKGGYYAVTTNATANPVASSVIILENSTFIADETALLINIPANVTARKCTFTGGWQGAFLRGGTYTFEDCKIGLAMNPDYNDVPEDNNNSDGTWKDGNQAVSTALLIGNRCTLNAPGYNYPTSVTLKNTEFSVSGTNKDGKTAQETSSVYIWSREETDNGTTFNYDETSYNSFQNAGSGLFVGNDGKNLTVNGEAYVAE